MKPPWMALLALALPLTAAGEPQSKDYYKRPSVFSTRPDEKTSLQVIKRFGPVGMSIELHQPAFVMKVGDLEEGSPAERAGGLKKGQIIESINGEKLADIDPRIQLGGILAGAEATDGLLRFRVRDSAKAPAREVPVRIPVLGAYSPTWPLNCPKSDKIVRNLADHLATPKANRGLGGIGLLFLVSTGEEKDLELAGDWIRELTSSSRTPTYAWHLGYGGLGLCEYYLKTGDPAVLPLIQRWVDSAQEIYYLGGWAGRGHGNFRYMGGGHLNAAGSPCAAFVLMAKECGADVRLRVLVGALDHFYRYAGRGNNPYGDQRPENGFVDNGKNGALAFTMAAAASLSPDGENSLYARARDVSAIKGFYLTSFMLHGHTGGGIGEIWRSAAMGLLHEKKPRMYRSFMDGRAWHYDLSRRWDGSFGILGGGGYDKEQWGVAYGLTYTIPRRTLRLTGAPPSRFSKKYALPKRPWGTEADDAFLSLDPVQGSWDHETIATDSAMHFLRKLDSKETTDDTLVSYVHHQDHEYRRQAACRLAGVKLSYLGGGGGGAKGNPGLLLPLLKAPDPRVRHAALVAVQKAGGRIPRDDALVDTLVDMIANPRESWWVVDGALQVLGSAKPGQIAPHIDLVLPWLRHREWWLQNAAITALAPVAADPNHYRKILPVMGEMMARNQKWPTFGPFREIVSKLRSAPPDVQKLAREMLGKTFAGYPELDTARPGAEVLVPQGLDSNLELIARQLAEIPGGFDVLYDVARARFPNQILPYRDLYLANPNPERFGPKIRAALKPTIRAKLIPEHIGKNRTTLLKEMAAEVQSPFVTGKLDELAALHRKIDVDDYDWRLFGPDLRETEWSYHTFDPIEPEQVPWDQLITRYRKVTLPKGMERWFDPSFDPDRAGWKKGRPAFAQYNGTLPDFTSPCSNRNCFGRTQAHTLWDKEVILLRGTFDIPRMKEGHRYRIRVNDGDHVGDGGGYAIYINGKLLLEQEKCVGRGGGGKPKGAFITREFLGEFRGGKVTVAVISFLRFNNKYKVKPKTRVPQGRISLHFEEMKLPVLGPKELAESAAVLPMFSMAWQEKQDPENRELQTGNDMYRYGGTFAPNRKLVGRWKVVEQLRPDEGYEADKKRRHVGRPPWRELSLLDGGRTHDLLWIWSGDMLMDLARNQALRMTLETVDGDEVLFIEAGGFSTRNKPGWRPNRYVLRRTTP